MLVLPIQERLIALLLKTEFEAVMKNFELRHKDYPVLTFELFPKLKVLEIINKDRCPIPTEEFNRSHFMEWFIHRFVNLRTREKAGSDYTVHNLLTADVLDRHGANLVDHYWFCEKGSPLRWSDVNYFENDFAINSAMSLDIFDTPDIATNGNLRKYWTIRDKTRYLNKYNSIDYDTFQIGAHTEVFAAKLLEKLGINHAEYEMGYDEERKEYYSSSRCFIDTKHELVPMFLLFEMYKKPNHFSDYDWLLTVCKDKAGIDIQKSINAMLVFDYLIANEDRHWNNFGLLRNSDTLEYVGLAPLYDHECSMGTNPYFKTRTFKSKPDAQLKLASSVCPMNLTRDFLLETWENVYNFPQLDSDKAEYLAKAKRQLLYRFDTIQRTLQA